MREQLISFETAIIAKEKGFDVKTERFYNEQLKSLGYYSSNEDTSAKNHNIYKENFSAPTQSLLQKWLREKMDMWITINFDGMTYSISIYGRYTPDGGEMEITNTGSEEFADRYFLRYEQALEIGLQETLKLINLKP